MPEVTLKLPKPHAGQVQVISNAARFNVLQCGRRFGKTTLGHQLAIAPALQGKPVGWFAPSYKVLLPAQEEIFRLLRPVAETNKVERRLRTVNGGTIEFWSLDDPDAGRSRKYARVIIDEASIAPNLQEAWESAIRPTLTDLRGDAWFLNTPKGRNFAHKLFMRGENGEKDWKSWRLATTMNPHIPPDEIEAAKRELPEHVFNQEFLGIPADDGGNPFGLKAIAECIRPQSSAKAVVFGVDLAKSQDWTVCVGLDERGHVCFLERWQGNWRETTEKLIRIIGNVPALIDSTGVGDPIVEALQAKLPRVEGFKFTQPSKQQLMEGLAAAIQQGLIGYPDGWLKNELDSFEYEYTRTGVRYTAPQGLHDDGVCALALANRKKTMASDFLEFSVTVPEIKNDRMKVMFGERGWS